MSTITLTQTDSPSRSKMAGPCWIAIKDGNGPGSHLFATEAGKTYDTDKDTVTIVGAANIRHATRTGKYRIEETLRVTGNETDTVTLQVGSAQYVVVTVTGVQEV